MVLERFNSRDHGENNEYNGTDFVELSKILLTQDTYCFGVGTFDGVDLPIR